MKPIQPGSKAPSFTLPQQDGTPVSLEQLLQSGPVVLFWYPAASSGGCTKEACHFRDLGSEFDAVGAHRVGISMDKVAAQQGFADGEALDYPLLSDASGEVASAYGVRRRFITPVKRATFVIDTDQTVREVVTSELNFEVHADKALASLRG